MPDIQRNRFILFAALVLLAGRPVAQSAENASAASISFPPTIARVHWLGMKQLSGATNAASLMTIWNLPESGKLEKQTLDKLSLAPWRLLHRIIDTNAAALLRPLLDDLAAEESYLEIRQTTNPPGELVFAIRLDDQRAALWQTNLAAVLELLTGIPPVPAPGHRYGWSLKKHHDPNFIELTRASGWTIVGAAEDHNGLLDDLRARIQHGQAPWTTGNAHDWLEASLDPAQLVPSLLTFNFQPSTFNCHHLHLAVTGDGTNVLIHGTADFARPLALDLEPWNVPTNLINWQVCSFTAIRGLGPWLKSLKTWNDLKIGPPPDQIYFWAMPGSEMHSYFAAPLPDASNEVDRFTDWVLQNQGRRFPTNQLARFERSTEFNGLQWKGLPYMWPFLRSITNDHQNFVYAGGFPNPSAYPISGQWLEESLGGTNLVYYDSEETGTRVGQWIYMGQFARYVSQHAQLSAQSPAVLWLKAISPKLSYTVTHVTETAPDQLSFTRRSSIGFTAVELNLLADWLESPQFPVGLHTLLAPPPPLM
ncbi:MAG: hypothetical protein ACLPRE_15665 [Limisphaerales bacterium]